MYVRISTLRVQLQLYLVPATWYVAVIDGWRPGGHARNSNCGRKYKERFKAAMNPTSRVVPGTSRTLVPWYSSIQIKTELQGHLEGIPTEPKRSHITLIGLQ